VLRARLIDYEKIVIEEYEKPKITRSEVLIKTSFCGICGSDIAAYLGKNPFVHPPIVLGHEVSGIIEDIGESVRGLKKGDRVIVEPLKTCGKCYNCRIGNYNQCESLKIMGCQFDGAFCEAFVAQAERVYRIPDTLSLQVASLIEPLSVAVHAIRRGGVKADDNIVIIGDGPIGILTAAVAREVAANALVVGISDEKLRVAEFCGAKHVINVTTERNVIKRIKEIFPRVDATFECVGHTAETLDLALKLTRMGGRVVVLGLFERAVPVEVSHIQGKELEVLGSRVYISWDVKQAIKLAEKLSDRLQRLITKIFPLKDVEQAFRYIIENRDRVLKVLIKVD